MSEEDLAGIVGKKDKFAGKLQERDGDGKHQAEPEAGKILLSQSAAPSGVSPQTTASVQASALILPAQWEPTSLGAPASPIAVLPSSDEHPLKNCPEPERLPEAGYTHSATVWISPRILRWVAPVMGVALVILLFLPWTGAYPGGYRVYSQNAFQTIWGGVSVSPLGTEALDHLKPYGTVEANRLMLFYTLLVLSALVLLLAPVWLTPSRVQAFSPIVRLLWRWRLELLGAMTLTAFGLLLAQVWTGFGLDAAVATRADSNLAGEFAAASTPAEKEKATIHRGLELGTFSFGHTFWLHLAVFSHALLLVCLVLELWLAWRGNRPLPRIDGHA